MDITNLKILVAEDNELNIFIIRKLLEKWGIIPDFAQNGLEAIEAYQTHTYDLILMDLDMPLLNGYQAASLIRNDKDTEKSRIPIIALTASLESEVKNEIAQAGIDDCISKPFDTAELKSKLDDVAIKKRS